jgi:hypothetical protein
VETEGGEKMICPLFREEEYGIYIYVYTVRSGNVEVPVYLKAKKDIPSEKWKKIN